tara:strand:- start:226 stop:429 length:204 start_codon:yes stop_codon:yes gene_type:complete
LSNITGGGRLGRVGKDGGENGGYGFCGGLEGDGGGKFGIGYISEHINDCVYRKELAFVLYVYSLPSH